MNHLTTFYIVLLLILYAIRLYETWPRDNEDNSFTLTIKSKPQIYCPKEHLRNLGTIALTVNNIDYYVLKDGEYLGKVNFWELKAIKRGRLPRRNRISDTKVVNVTNDEVDTIQVPVTDVETGEVREETFLIRTRREEVPILGSNKTYYRNV